MLRISKLTDYATVLMVEMQSDASAPRSATVLAECTQLEVPTAAKVLKTLARAGLVRSIRGVNGGYLLDHPAERISVAAIIRAMEGPIALTECALDHGICAREDGCSLRSNWQRIGETVEQALEAMSLADLAAPSIGLTGRAGLKLVNRTHQDTTSDTRN